MKPLISKQYLPNHMLNAKRVWVPAVNTNIAATFARVRAEAAKATRPAR